MNIKINKNEPQIVSWDHLNICLWIKAILYAWYSVKIAKNKKLLQSYKDGFMFTSGFTEIYFHN